MATVISNASLSKHNVNKYTFKVIGSPSKNQKEKKLSQESHPNARKSDKVDSSALSSSSKESLIESLMKKTDDMSSNFIKLQMKLETKEEEYEVNVKKAKEEAFSEGIEAGKAQAIQNAEVSQSNALSLFASSVKKLDASANDFELALEKVKNNLMHAALDIAKEVVNLEVGDNSANIAKILSSELIKELQSASKITLKVNPKDHGVISQHVGSLKHIEVLSDSAISEGGVVAISDAGNIDAQISKRFEKVKKVVLSE